MATLFKIDVQDRISTYPGRVQMQLVPGTSDMYDMVRADMPISDGTPINKALFDSKADVLKEDVIVYVTKIGDDIAGDGSISAPFATIQKAIDALPKYLGGHTAQIDILDGEYLERIVVSGFVGGKLTIGSPGNRRVVLNGIDIDGSSFVEINISNLTYSTDRPGNLIRVSNGSHVYLGKSMTIDCGSASANGISATYNSTVSAAQGLTITVNNSGGAVVMSTGGSVVSLYRVTGTNNMFGLSASMGGLLTYDSSSVESFMGDDAWAGGRIHTGAGVSALSPASIE